MSADVSVVIPAFNAGPYIRESLESVLAQTLRPRQIIVVDDGSTDQTGEIVDTFGSRVTAVRQANQGVATARNHGARIATGVWLAFLDADDAWRPKKLEAQVALAMVDNLRFIHCGSEKIDDRGRFLSTQLDGLSGRVTEGMLLFRGNHANGSTTLVHKELFEAVGGYDPRLSTSADWDLCFRLGRLASLGFVAEPLAFYRQHGTNMHANPSLMRADMLAAFEKAFRNPEPDIAVLRRRAYAALHLVLSGSFAAYGKRVAAARHGITALLWSPDAFTSVVRGLARVSRRRGVARKR